jgi:hypothetical protein
LGNQPKIFSDGISTGNETLVYDENTFVPTDGSGAGLTFPSVVGRYTKIGRQVTVIGNVTYPATANGSQAKISLPINANSAGLGVVISNGVQTGNCASEVGVLSIYIMGTLTPLPNSSLSGATVYFTCSYFV